MNLSGPLILVFIYLAMVVIGLYLAFALISAIVRMSHALESASRSLEVIAAKYGANEPKPPQQ